MDKNLCMKVIFLYMVLHNYAYPDDGVVIDFSKKQNKHSYIPQNGFVSNDDVAIKIATAVWGNIYGEDKIAAEKPYIAILKGDVWYITGSLQVGSDGGVAIAEISKIDGKILRISHGK